MARQNRHVDGERTPTCGVGVTAKQLLNELSTRAEARTDKEPAVRLSPEQQCEVIANNVLESLFDEENFLFDESVVKENLDEILLLLVAHRDSDTNGKRLMSDLATVFDTHLSPGTIYPRLHELETSGLLHVQELVRTKEYQVADGNRLVEHVEAAVKQHIALGLLLQSALVELSLGELDLDVEI